MPKHTKGKKNNVVFLNTALFSVWSTRRTYKLFPSLVNRKGANEVGKFPVLLLPQAGGAK